MEVGINVNLHNKFEFEIRDAETNELKQTAIAHNIILNNMYNYLTSRAQFMAAIHLGTGNITEDDLDPTATSLHTSVVRRATTLDSRGNYLDNMYRRVKIQLEPAEYVDSKFSEVGLAGSTSTTSLLTHALITDSEGNPIVIEKTALDVLIIYATVYFTIGNLPAHIKLANIDWDKRTTSNNLLNYLTSGGTTNTLNNTISLGTFGNSIATEIGSSLCGTSIGSKEVYLDIDSAERKIIFPVKRFEIAEGNGHIQEISFGNSFNANLPNINYTGTQYNNVPLSGQNGNKIIFELPSVDIDKATIEVMKNGIPVAVDIIDLPYYKKYNARIPNNFYPYYFLTDNAAMTGHPQQYPDMAGLSFIKGDWVKTSIMPIDVGVGIKMGNEYIYMEKTSTDLNLGVYDPTTDTHNLLRRITSATSNSPAGFVKISERLVGMRYRNTYGTASYPFVGWYCRDDEGTWNLIDSGGLTTKVGCAGTNKIKEIFKAENSLTWQKLSTDLSGFTQINVIGQVDHKYIESNPDGSIIISYGGNTPGVASYHENSAFEWEKNELIGNDSDTNIYTRGWFIANDTLLLLNTSIGSLWKKIDGIWTNLVIGIPIKNFKQSEVYIPSHYNPFCITPSGSAISDAYYNLALSASSTYTRGMALLTDGSYVIKFDTPPLATDEITVSYKVNGIHKTDQYVLDVGAYIQFGEG